MTEQAHKDRAKALNSRLYDLVEEEREIGREVGARVLAGQPVSDLRERRREVRETQEDLHAASSLLHTLAW